MKLGLWRRRDAAVGAYQSPGPKLNPAIVFHHNAERVQRSLPPDCAEYQDSRGTRWHTIVVAPLRHPGGQRNVAEAHVLTHGVIPLDTFEPGTHLDPQ